MKQLDFIRIDSLPVECIVGVLSEERTKTQPLVVSVELRLDLTLAAETGIFKDTVDYSVVAKEIAFILTVGRFPMLESAAVALSCYLARAPVEAARVKLTKPRALNDVGTPSVSVERTPRFDFTGFGPLFACPDAGVFRLKSSGDHVPKPYRWNAHEDLSLPDGKVLRVYRK